MAPALQDTVVFEPITIGKHTLSQRIAHLPTTRYRAADDHTPSQLQLQYYTERSKIPGTFLITEGTFVSEGLGGYDNIPGIFTDKHVAGWKKIVDAVHANKSIIALQIWSLGRGAEGAVLAKYGLPYIAPSDLNVSEEWGAPATAAGNPLRALTTEEVDDIIHVQYPAAARRALEAGFDFVELHGANGYLIEQFLSPTTNNRTDKYGGSIEKRAKFVLDIVDELIEIVGADRLAVRLSPWNNFLNMKSELDEVHPIAQFGYVISELQKRSREGKELAYLSLAESRFNLEGNELVVDNTFAAQIWKGKLVRGGNYAYDSKTWENVIRDVGVDDRTIAGFGRNFIANPDLITKLRDGLDLNVADRSTFYTKTNFGYNTYTSHGEEKVIDQEVEDKIVAISLA